MLNSFCRTYQLDALMQGVQIKRPHSRHGCSWRLLLQCYLHTVCTLITRNVAVRQVYEGRTYSFMQPGAAGADATSGNMGASRRLLEGAMRTLLLQKAHVELVPGCVVSDLAWSADGRSVRGERPLAEGAG